MNLGRLIGEKSMEERIRRGDAASTNPIALLRASSKDTPTSESSGQRHDRERRPSSESCSTTNSQRKPRPPAITISADSHPAVLRPPLSTMKSNTHADQAPARPQRPKLVPMDSTSSLQVLQELVSPLSLNASPAGKLNVNKLNALGRSPSPLSEAAIKLPPADAHEDQALSPSEVDTRRWSMAI